MLLFVKIVDICRDTPIPLNTEHWQYKNEENSQMGARSFVTQLHTQMDPPTLALWCHDREEQGVTGPFQG